MKVKNGQMIKVFDIGTPGKVIETKSGSAIVEFNFDDGLCRTEVPFGIIDCILQS